MFECSPPRYRRAYKRHILRGSAYLSVAEGKEELVTLKNLSGAGACVCGKYHFKMNELVPATIRPVPQFFNGLFNKRVRVAWSKQLSPNFWEAGLDFLSHV
jgi:hypothetical protein